MSIARIVAAVDTRTRSIVDALGVLDDADLVAPSQLPDWSRLTIACHLRFGTNAFLRMTRAALRGEPVAYYPEGRNTQRPTTLTPGPSEQAGDVVESLRGASRELHAAWTGLDDAHWDLAVTEPTGQTDLGSLALSRLPLLRLTEVEVHGSDLGIGLDDWSDTFVTTALPFRLEWLNTRRVNHREVDASIEGSWLLRASDGPAYLVAVDNGRVDSHPTDPATPARAIVEATSRDLLALLLGRPLTTPPVISGDAAFGRSFSRAFPGP